MNNPPAVIVVDASIAVKWLIAEPDSEWALSITRHGSALVAPELLLSESGNALWKLARRGLLASTTQAALYASLDTSPLRIMACGAAMHAAALRLANTLDHPIYDCVYLALAIEVGGMLATADARFAAVLRRSVVLPPDRLLTPPS